MCLRVYLNGDGTGRGTHLSLFFVVMKGPNDALLRWPFNQKVGPGQSRCARRCAARCHPPELPDAAAPGCSASRSGRKDSDTRPPRGFRSRAESSERAAGQGHGAQRLRLENERSRCRDWGEGGCCGLGAGGAAGAHLGRSLAVPGRCGFEQRCEAEAATQRGAAPLRSGTAPPRLREMPGAGVGSERQAGQARGVESVREPCAALRNFPATGRDVGGFLQNVTQVLLSAEPAHERFSDPWARGGGRAGACPFHSARASAARGCVSTCFSFSRSRAFSHLPPQVTLMLLDQNNREHIIDAFRPDVTSSSFQRPITEMNIASGCPLFCPVSVMEAKNSYVRDDAIFIKAIVDLTGL